jgi:hypothetical protein
MCLASPLFAQLNPPAGARPNAGALIRNAMAGFKALILGSGLLLAGITTRAQPYAPIPQFFNDDSGPLLYNQFVVGAANGSYSPYSLTPTVTNATPDSGGPNYTGTMAASGPFDYSRTATNSSTFPTFIGTVTATERSSMSTSANYGLLSASGTATATGSFSEAYFGNYSVTAAGENQVQYTDSITITPTLAHPAGTFVPVTFTEAFANSNFSVVGNSPATFGELLGTLFVSGYGPVAVNDLFGESYQSSAPFNGGHNGPTGISVPLPFPTYNVTYGDADSVTASVDLDVGSTYEFTGGLTATGWASGTWTDDEGLTNAENSISMGATEYTLIDTGGLGYSTESGTQYLTQLPGNPTSSVPEGGFSLALLGMASAGLAFLRRRITA